jgi:DNA-directed RNA polymerase III subunit RPC1
LISGNIAKKTIGDGSKTGLLYILLRDWGSAQAARIMDRWAKLCGRWMGSHKGFSIGISDVTPSEVLQKLKHGILLQGFKKASSPLVASNFQGLQSNPFLIASHFILFYYFILQADESIASYEKGTLELRPGCDLLQSLEEILNGILGRLRESAGQEAMKALPWTNTPRIMADAGSKGAFITCILQYYSPVGLWRHLTQLCFLVFQVAP